MLPVILGKDLSTCPSEELCVAKQRSSGKIDLSAPLRSVVLPNSGPRERFIYLFL